MKTTVVKDSEVKRAWHLIDAADKPVGRIAVKIAHLLRGKNKASYTPQTDMGDFVVVINAQKVKLSGAKEEQKLYKKFTGFPDGLKLMKASEMRVRHPEYIVYHAVRDMLPRNTMSRLIISHLKVYAGAEHPHAAQNPQPLKI